MKLLDRIFKMEEMDGDGRCPYLRRWTLLRTPWFCVYLHHFIGDDWSRDLHDHPKRFISIGLWGSYIEETPLGSRRYRAPWIRWFPPEHIHRLRLIDGKPCWTAVIVFRPTRQWGFWVDGNWVPWHEYIGSETADAHKSCP